MDKKRMFSVVIVLSLIMTVFTAETAFAKSYRITAADINVPPPDAPTERLPGAATVPSTRRPEAPPVTAR